MRNLIKRELAFKYFMVVCISFFATFTNFAVGQISLDQIKLDIFSNPNTVANQNYIRLLNAQEKNNFKKEYLFEDWKPMEVLGTGNEYLTIDSANYHISTDRILFIQSKKLYQLYPSLIKKLQLENKRIQSFYTYTNNKQKDKKYNYFEVLVIGELPLLKKYELKTVQKNNHPMGLPEGRTSEMVSSEKLFYFDPKLEIATEIPRKKTDVIKLFGRKKNKMISFARKRNLSLKSESDIILLFRYYNLLIEQENG